MIVFDISECDSHLLNGAAEKKGYEINPKISLPKKQYKRN